MSTLHAGTASWVQKSRGICGGDACIRLTRHTVAGLVQWKQLGLSESRILEHHPDLSRSDLDAAWAYERAYRDEIDNAIRVDEDA